MPLLAPSSSATPFCFSQLKTHNSNSQTRFSSNSFTPFQNRTAPLHKTRHKGSNFTHKFSSKCNGQDDDSYTEEYTMSLDWDDEEEIADDDKKIEDTESPWEGAIIYKRNASVLHLEYCTTLERLGLGRLSDDITKNKASVMGLRIAKTVKDYPNGTPVQVSVDVTRKKKKLRLDGIIKTVIKLPCNRDARTRKLVIGVLFTWNVIYLFYRVLEGLLWFNFAKTNRVPILLWFNHNKYFMKPFLATV